MAWHGMMMTMMTASIETDRCPDQTKDALSRRRGGSSEAVLACLYIDIWGRGLSARISPVMGV